MVVDCNGDIFFNNLILSKPFFPLRDQLKIGNIRYPDRIQWNKKFDFNRVIRLNSDPNIYFSTQVVDKILTSFVNKLTSKDL